MCSSSECVRVSVCARESVCHVNVFMCALLFGINVCEGGSVNERK